MLATVASPGQRTLQIAGEKAPPDTLAVIVMRHRKTGEPVQYTIADSLLHKLGEWNKTLDPRDRYDEMMKAEGLFAVATVK